MIYLDNAAATKPLPCALTAMNEVLKSAWANPNSAHDAGQKAREIIEQARNTVARCLDCLPEEVHFCGSASEAAAIVYKSLYQNYGDEIIKSPTEHDAVYALNTEYCRSHTSSSQDKPSCFRMLVNNETGEVYDVKQFVEDHPNIVVAVDATAAVGHIPVSFRTLGASYLFCDALKFGGVPGCGILLVKSGQPISDLMHHHTPHTALIAACAAALEWYTEHMDWFLDFCLTLRCGLVGVLSREKIDYTFPAGRATAHSHILSVRFPGVENTALALLLSKNGVMVSTGAACSSGEDTPSRVLMASGLSEQEARETIRISFGLENTVEEVRQAGHIIAKCVRQLKELNQ